MSESERTDVIARVRSELKHRAFVRASDDARIVHKRAADFTHSKWLFDIRAIALTATVLDDLTALFWDTFGERDSIQVGGLETAAIPLVTAVVMSGHKQHHRRDMSGFFIRKSRKKEGLTRMIEGTLRPGVPIVLVDDLMNSGSSLRRQVEVLEGLGHRVTDIWTLVRFRDLDFYSYFSDKGIAIRSLFELNDFSDLQLRNLTVFDEPRTPSNYKVQWKFASPRPSYHYVVPKSDPAIDDQRVYIGSDTGMMRALDQGTGQLSWEYQIGFHPKGKGIFSSPAVHDGILYFGGYDGNVYALDAATGTKKWMSLEADWVGSSPALAPELGLMFIGLEYGLWRKRGGIAALDMRSGKTAWRFDGMPCYTHSSPHYIEQYKEVAIGSNDGCVYLFDAVTGALRWKIATGPITLAELNAGFSAHDIKESIAYAPQQDLVIAATMSGSVYFIDRASGTVRAVFKAEFGFCSTPLVVDTHVYVSSLDKHLYCIDLTTFNEKWRWYGGARIFASPVSIERSIFIGTNTGRLTELDPSTGRELSFFIFSERITNKVAYNAATKRYFVPTFANEIYAIEKTPLPE